MLLGINLLCITGFVEQEHLPFIELAQEIGYDGVEIPVLNGTPKHYARLASKLDKLGLCRTCTAIVPDPATDPTSADSDIRRRGEQHLRWIVECATALGAEVIGGPFHAPIGHFTGTGATPEEWKRGAESHHRMAERAAQHSIALALEPLNRFETYFLNTATQAATYSKLVNHPNFGIMYDTFHSHIEEKSQPDAIAQLGVNINVLHVSENDRGIPGTGQIDFNSVFRAVKDIKFDSWVVVEAFGTGVPEIAAATRIWRPMFDSYTALLRESASFVRNMWQKA